MPEDAARSPIDASAPPPDLGQDLAPIMAGCRTLRVPTECSPEQPIRPLAGSRAVVLSRLAFAPFDQGFDLNCDGLVDNKLAPLGAVANAQLVSSLMTTGDPLTAIELFGYQGADAACVKFAGYFAKYDCAKMPCDPFQAMPPLPLHVHAASLPNGIPSSRLLDGAVVGGVWSGDGGSFIFSIPLGGGMGQPMVPLIIHLTHVRAELPLSDGAAGTSIAAGTIGGVWDVIDLSLTHAGGIFANGSLLDEVFVGPLGAILGLDSDQDGHYLPDIDVDGDGLETFWQTQPPPPGHKAQVDTCRDGDGTIVHNNWDGQGTPCVLAVDGAGKPRFVDGISAAFLVNAVPAKLVDVAP